MPRMVVRKVYGDYKTKKRILKLTKRTSKGSPNYFVVGLSKKGLARQFYIHRLVYMSFVDEIPPGIYVDHINRNSLDNRLINLRLLTPTQSQMNTTSQISSSNSKYHSMYKGVHKSHNKTNPYVARHRRVHLGYFKLERDAARAYDSHVKGLYGDIAVTNFNEDN